MFHVILGLPWLVVVVFRFLLPLALSLPLKIVVATLLLLASQHLLINRLSSGSVFAPEYPRPLIIVFNVLFGAMLLLAMMQTVLDVVLLALLPFPGRFAAVAPEIRAACLALPCLDPGWRAWWQGRMRSMRT